MFENRNAFTCYVTWRKIETKCKTSLNKIIDTGRDLENEIGGEGREKYEERRECKYKFQINYIEQVNSINLRKA